MKFTLFTLVFVLACSLHINARPAGRRHGPSATFSPAAESEAISEKMAEAVQFFENEDYAKAEEAFKKLRARKLPRSTWGMVSNNLGLVLKIEEKYGEAIEVFESILVSDVNDRDPGGHIMENFRNYRHKASIQIALCYEAKGDIPKALEYIELARTKYAFEAHCGNCAEDAAARLKALEKRFLLAEKKT